MQNQPLDQKTLYHNIYDGEIFEKSRCIWHENTLMDFFRSNLTALGYTPANESNKVWKRGDRTVAVCLVDDFSTCGTDTSTTFPYIFDKDTVVITDNYATVPTQYKVFQLPTSFFGIYKHTPADTQWRPSRRFNFSVNRLDTKRMLLFLEIWNRCMLMDSAANLDYMNFNCWTWGGDNSSVHGLKENFTQQWNQLEPQFHKVYQHVYDDLINRIPFRNHNLSHEESHVSAWMNVVIETYSSDTNIALSEKTFRSLCLPVPCILYSGKHTIAYLHSLGFDLLRDLVEHRYDGLIENKTAEYGDKMVDFVFDGTDAVTAFEEQDFSAIKQRCIAAAENNRQVLEKMAQQWPEDFAAWWPNVVKEIK